MEILLIQSRAIASADEAGDADTADIFMAFSRSQTRRSVS